MRIQNLTKEKFKDFGDIIEYNKSNSERFQVIINEPAEQGWRIAINKVNRDDITILGLHPNTRETFEPLSGLSVLVVAKQSSPEKMKAFLLDKPVCLKKSIWHATVSLSDYAYIKIVENAVVEQEEFPLKNPLNIGII